MSQQKNSRIGWSHQFLKSMLTSGYKNPLWGNKRDQLRIAEDKYKIDNDYVKYHERIVDITEGTKQKIKSKKQKPKNVIPKKKKKIIIKHGISS